MDLDALQAWRDEIKKTLKFQAEIRRSHKDSLQTPHFCDLESAEDLADRLTEDPGEWQITRQLVPHWSIPTDPFLTEPDLTGSSSLIPGHV